MVVAKLEREKEPSGKMLGHRIKELREERGLSKADLARALNLSEPAIWKLENRNQGIPDAEMLKAIAELLGTDSLDLLMAAGYYDLPESIRGVDPRLVAAFNKLTPEKQKRFSKVMLDQLRLMEQ